MYVLCILLCDIIWIIEKVKRFQNSVRWYFVLRTFCSREILSCDLGEYLFLFYDFTNNNKKPTVSSFSTKYHIFNLLFQRDIFEKTWSFCSDYAHIIQFVRYFNNFRKKEQIIYIFSVFVNLFLHFNFFFKWNNLS